MIGAALEKTMRLCFVLTKSFSSEGEAHRDYLNKFCWRRCVVGEIQANSCYSFTWTYQKLKIMNSILIGREGMRSFVRTYQVELRTPHDRYALYSQLAFATGSPRYSAPPLSASTVTGISALVRWSEQREPVEGKSWPFKKITWQWQWMSSWKLSCLYHLDTWRM